MASESACRLSPVLSHPAGAGLKASCVPFPPGENLCSLHLDCCVLSRFSCVWLFVTPWTAARQVCLSVGFSRQESWSGLPCPLPEDLPHPGTESESPALAAGFFTLWATRKAPCGHRTIILKETYCIAHRTLLSVMRQPRWEGSFLWGEQIHMYVVESLCYSPETITTLLIGYTPIQN